MKIAIIGMGAIAGYVRQQLPRHQIREIAQIVRLGKVSAPSQVDDIDDLSERPDLVVDCGGHKALAQHGPKALAKGIDVLTVSLGALADPVLYACLEQAAVTGSARLRLASGAIGGLDVLRAATVGQIEQVTYTGRKPPKGWIGSPAADAVDLASLTAPYTHFQGTARNAALAYPKNANVAAAVALAGAGFDKTQVNLIADPGIDANIHEVSAKGDFGTLQCVISGNSLPDNPRSSALAAMSIMAELAASLQPIRF